MSAFDNLKVGLFFGSDTGNTEVITNDFVETWDATELEVIAAIDMKKEDYARFDFIIIGLSTWYDGDLQSDFEDFFPQFQEIDFTGKIVAMYGLGDQLGYDEYFVDGLGILGEVILKNGGKIIGMWPTEGYDYTKSKGEFNDKLFYGLALDEDNEMEKTAERLEAWIPQVVKELEEALVANPVG
ncbi:MAG: flavodoxin [Bacteroidota bacterium]